jgi:nitrous oxide reductase accessory protein NosL
MNIVKLLFFIFLVSTSFSGCEKKTISTEPHTVHWDRDMCERCKMVTSDRHHTVQVINPKTGKSYMFDDIGCTLLWFDDEKIAWRDKAVVWITDVDTGKWIDAKEALYDADNITPMAYGFAAHKSKDKLKKGSQIIHYQDLFKEVLKLEEKNNNRKAY